MKIFSMQPNKQFIHHVFFWLNNQGSEQDRQQLIQGLEKIKNIPTIQTALIGVPAATNREVVDNSYAVSWLLFFQNKEDHDQYQDDPVHHRFIKECAHLWQRVVVYDTVAP